MLSKQLLGELKQNAVIRSRFGQFLIARLIFWQHSGTPCTKKVFRIRYLPLYGLFEANSGGAMSEQHLRKKFTRQFIGFSKYSRYVAWLVVAWYVAQIVLAIVAGNFLLAQPLSVVGVTLMVLTAIFIGTRLRGLNNMVHECSHYTLSDHRSDNVVLGSLCASILTGCFHQYKKEHLSHHAHLGDYELDLDLKGIKDFRLHEPLTTANVIRHLTNPLLGRHLRQYSGVNLSAKDGVFFQCFKIVLLVAILVFAIFQPLTAIFFVLIPWFYIFPTINYWTDCLDHAGIVAAGNEMEASRNVLIPRPLRFLLFPRNDCFHLVHHLFPLVPARHLESAHDALSEDAAYQEQRLAVQPTHRAVTGFLNGIIVRDEKA